MWMVTTAALIVVVVMLPPALSVDTDAAVAV
jgi:hypothetical protein